MGTCFAPISHYIDVSAVAVREVYILEVSQNKCYISVNKFLNQKGDVLHILVHSTNLRILASYEAEIAKNCNFRTFWTVIQLINHFFKIWQKAFFAQRSIDVTLYEIIRQVPSSATNRAWILLIDAIVFLLECSLWTFRVHVYPKCVISLSWTLIPWGPAK